MLSWIRTLRSLASRLRSPISAETRRLLLHAAKRVPADFRTAQQFLGKQYAGCGGTIGAMPRCDFACRGCYLGREANSVPPQPLSEIRRQLDHIRAWLGEGGNVQLTDGELTLLREAELVELIRYARNIGLVPMLMTHGDVFRRNPRLLERLVVDGGLTEVSIHIDTTQRGRSGAAYKHATREEELLPLRDEFARMIRRVRRATGRRLKVATTFTVTRENLSGVPVVIRWMLRNADAFAMISFQPIAQVGRTEEGLGGSVSVEDLWTGVAEGIFGDSLTAEDLLQHQGWLGHPDCSRFVQGVTVSDRNEEPVFIPLFRQDHEKDQEFLREWLERFGGLPLRLDTRIEAVFRLAGLVRQDPRFMLGKTALFFLRQLRRVARGAVLPFLWRWFRGQVRVQYFNIVSHHFMSQAELETPRGQERLDLCTFKVPIGERLVSMCEVNSLGLRERYYRAIGPTIAPREPVV